MIHDRFIHDALRAADPYEMRLIRGRQCGPHSGTMTLITTSDSRKEMFADSLRDGRKDVSCIQHDGMYFWLVQAPSGAVRRALRRLGWIEIPDPDRPAEGPEESHGGGAGKDGGRPCRAPVSRQNFRPRRPRRRKSGG